jgi:hypothetical protein
MFSLLLLLFMVTTELQPEPMQVPQVQTPTVQEFWRTTRPLNQRTQVMNTYLDSVQWINTLVIWDWVETIIPHYVYYKTGILWWDRVDWEFQIVSSWTYIIQVDFSTETVGWELTLTIYNWTTDIYTRTKVIDSIFEKEQDISRVFKRNKWDVITCSLTQTSWWDSWVWIVVSIIKIS